jgi:hypothetical protein
LFLKELVEEELLLPLPCIQSAVVITDVNAVFGRVHFFQAQVRVEVFVIINLVANGILKELHFASKGLFLHVDLFLVSSAFGGVLVEVDVVLSLLDL